MGFFLLFNDVFIMRIVISVHNPTKSIHGYPSIPETRVGNHGLEGIEGLGFEDTVEDVDVDVDVEEEDVVVELVVLLVVPDDVDEVVDVEEEDVVVELVVLLVPEDVDVDVEVEDVDVEVEDVVVEVVLLLVVLDDVVVVGIVTGKQIGRAHV